MKPTLRTAVITGAASGIGLALALKAARSGMRVFMADVERAALDEAATLVAQEGWPVIAEPVDVSNAEAVDALARLVVNECGAPHLVVNNAGVGVGGLLWEHSTADWEWVAGVNLLGVAHGVRAFTPPMLAAAAAAPEFQGHIVNTASMAGLAPAPNMGAYAVTKHAVVALSECLARDLALITEQVRAAVICPYFVPTRIGWSRRNRQEDGRPPRSQRLHDLVIRKATEIGSITAADVADLVFEALHRDSFYIFTHDELRAEAVNRIAAIASGAPPRSPLGALAQSSGQS